MGDLLGVVAAIFGFALAVAYCPWIMGAAATPRWCVLVIGAAVSLACLPAVRWRTAPVVWGCAFMGWALATIIFSPALEAMDQAWKLALYAALFIAGGQICSLRPFYAGAAAGLAISSALVIADLMGLISYQQASPPSGLFVNGLYLAEFSAMVLVGLLAEGMVNWVWLVLPAIMFGSVARGPLLALGVAGTISVLARWRSREAFVAMALLLIAVPLLIMWRPATVWVRIDLWLAMLPHLTWQGHGLGAFFSDGALMTDYLRDARPPHANNDLLEIAYDLGAVGAITAIGFIVSMLRGPMTAERLVILVFIIEGCFGFPFYLPWSAGLFCLAAGHLARRGDVRVPAAVPRRIPIRQGHGGALGADVA